MQHHGRKKSGELEDQLHLEPSIVDQFLPRQLPPLPADRPRRIYTETAPPNVPGKSLDEPGLERWPRLESAMSLAS